jgi:hypothetical protein
MLDSFGKRGFLAAYNAGPPRYEEYLARGRQLPAETVDYVRKLAPLIDGAAPISPTFHRRGDRRSALRSPIFVQSGREGNVGGTHSGGAPNTRSSTIFPAAGSPAVSASSSDTVTDLTVIEPRMGAASHPCGTTVGRAYDSAFVQLSSKLAA